MRRFRFLSGAAVFYFILLSFLTTCVLPPGVLASPAVEITSPTTDTEGNGTVWGDTQVDVTYHGDKGAPVVKLVLLLDGAVVKEYPLPRPQTEGTASFRLRFTLASGRVYALCAKAVDAAGESAATTVTLTVQKSESHLTSRAKADAVPPVISIFYPAQGAHEHGIINIKANGQSETGITSVFFYLDGKMHTALIGAPPWEDKLDTTRLTDGLHVLSASAFDAAENEGKSAEVTIIVENAKGTTTAPRLPQWTTPETGGIIDVGPTPAPAITPAAPPDTLPSVIVPPPPPAPAPVPAGQPAAPAFTDGPVIPVPLAVEPGAPDLLPGAKNAEPSRPASRTTHNSGLERESMVDTPAPAKPLPVATLRIAYLHTTPALPAPRPAQPGAASLEPATPAAGAQGALTPLVPGTLSGPRTASPNGQPTLVTPLPTHLIPPSAPPAGQGAPALSPANLTQAAAQALVAPLQAAGVAPATAPRTATPPTAVQVAALPPAPEPPAPAPALTVPSGEGAAAENPYEAEAAWNAAWGTPLLTVCPARDGQPPAQMPPTQPTVKISYVPAPAPTATPVTPATPQSAVAATTGSAASETEPFLPAEGASAAGARTSAPGTQVALLPTKPAAASTVQAPEKPAVADNVPAAIANIRGIKVVFDGKPLDLLAAPALLQGISMAPLREIFEHTNGTLYWYPTTKRVEAKNASVDLKMQIGHPQVQVNGATQTLVLAPYIKQGRTMVPLQFLADALNVTISYHPESGQIVISSNDF